MNPDDLSPLFIAQPFVPFTVRMTNDESYLIRHPDQAMIMGETLLVANTISPGRQELVRCAMINISSVKTVEGAEVA